VPVCIVRHIYTGFCHAAVAQTSLATNGYIGYSVFPKGCYKSALAFTH
jgi:hypothetical protein